MDPFLAKIVFVFGFVVANFVIRAPHIKAHKRLPIRSNRNTRLDTSLFIAVGVFGFFLPLLYVLPNYVAGFSGLLPFGILYFERVAREERMMIEEFGSEYERYLQKTGRLFPKLRPG